MFVEEKKEKYIPHNLYLEIILPIEKYIISSRGHRSSHWSRRYVGKDSSLCCEKAWLSLVPFTLFFFFSLPCRTSCLLILSSTAVVGRVRASVLKIK